MKLRKRILSLGAAMVMAVSMMSVGASAQSGTYTSNGGDYGTVKYALSVSGNHYGQGVDFYRLHAIANQVKTGSVFVQISQINMQAYIHIKTGGNNISSKTVYTKDANWYSNPVLSSAVVTGIEKGFVTFGITSAHYGNITKTLFNY